MAGALEIRSAGRIQPKSKGLKMLIGSKKELVNPYCLLDAKV